MIIGAAELSEAMTTDVAVCIVGSGAAGITLACEFDRCAFKVLLLEAGSYEPSAATQDYYQGTTVAPHPAATEFRRVALGGTTSIWGGRCVPYDPIDFERRDYIANSGWPLGYDEVAQYYPRALERCDAGRFDFTASGSIAHAPPTIAGLRPDGVLDSDLIERYSLPTDFGKRYRASLRESRNVTVVMGARCVGLDKAAGEDRLESLTVALASGARRRIRSTLIILASGGIETTRLLLASDANGVGFGNRSDLLGRFYASHLETAVGRLVPLGTSVVFDFEKTREGVYCRRKLQFTAAAQRRHALLNSAFRLHFPAYSDATHGSSVMSAIYLAKSFLIKEYRDILQQDGAAAVASPRGAHLRNVLTGTPQLASFGYDWLFKRQFATRKLPYTLVANADGSYPLEFNCEQTPLASSRITLGTATDAHGLRRVHIDWRRSEDDLAAAQRAFGLMRDSLNASGSCRVELDENELRSKLRSAPPVGGHHIGTARMGTTAANGVVDTQCALFDFPQVYLASSAVFPTGSHANPTLTIVALALRMAAHLRARLAAA